MASTSTLPSNKPVLAPSPYTVPADLPKLPEVAGTDPTRSVLDMFRIAIAKVVAEALEPLTVDKVYQGVDYGKKGEDFTVALPRFKLPGKVDELAKKVIDKVCRECRRLAPHCVPSYPILIGTAMCDSGIVTSEVLGGCSPESLVT